MKLLLFSISPFVFPFSGSKEVIVIIFKNLQTTLTCPRVQHIEKIIARTVFETIPF